MVLFMHSLKMGTPLHVFSRPVAPSNPVPRSYRNRTLRYSLIQYTKTRPTLLQYEYKQRKEKKTRIAFWVALRGGVKKWPMLRGIHHHHRQH